MARKKKHPEHVNHERWLISYADFITLLFAFFTSMYAISTVDAKKAGQLVFSTRAAFNIDFFPSDKPTLGGRGGTDSSGAARTNVIGDDIESKAGKPGKGGKGKGKGGDGKRGARLDGMSRKIDAVLAQMKAPGSVTVRREEDRMIISLAEQVFFEPGRANLRVKNLEAFHQVIAALADGGTDIRVEGHTDDEPLTRGPYRSNLELSISRAVSVVRYLNHEFAYPSELTSVAGFADARPVADNDTEKGRKQNRRVDIVVYAEPIVRGSAANPQPAPVESPTKEEIEIKTGEEVKSAIEAVRPDEHTAPHGDDHGAAKPHAEDPTPTEHEDTPFPSIVPDIAPKKAKAHAPEHAEH